MLAVKQSGLKSSRRTERKTLYQILNVFGGRKIVKKI